jgi:hypothetical protein
MKEEREHHQDHKECACQHPYPAEVVPDVSVVRVELCCARRWHKSCGLAYLSSVFLGHGLSP